MDLLHTVHVPAGDGPFPTVVMLHGWGASAHDLFGLAPYLHGGDALVLCPQGPLPVPVGPGMDGYGWFPLAGGAEPDLGEVERAVERLRGFLDGAFERYPADPQRVVLLGFSQGGFMAFELALPEPARFAGLVGLSTWLPAPLAERVARKPEHERLPALVVHGSEDPMIPVDRGRETRDALLALGIPTAYREYPMGHEIRPEALRHLVEWLEEKVFAPIQLA